MKNHMYSTNKLHKPYSMRSKKNHRVLGGLTSNSLLGVKWRFLQENSNEAYRADVHKPIPSHKYSHASFSRRRTPQARQHHHHTSESDHAKPHDIQGLSKGVPTTSPSQDAHSFSFVSLLEKNQEEEKAKARAGECTYVNVDTEYLRSVDV